MYTISSCSGSSVSNVDPLSSFSQLNSLIEFFSQAPVFSVGSTWSSSCFGFSIFSMGFFCHLLLFFVRLFIREAAHRLSTHHCRFDFFVFGCGLAPYGP